MSDCTVSTTSAARYVDLLNPRIEDYADFFWQAEHLAKVKRFNGATPNVEYSVAEHAARGADYAFNQTRDFTVAAAVLIHDNPEALLQDDTTPKKDTIAELIAERCGVLAPAILDCFKELERRHAECVHRAAGLPWPLPYGLKEAVKHFDKVMFVTEWRDLMGIIEHPDWAPYAGVEPLPYNIRSPRRFHTARRMWLQRAQRYLPVFADRRAVPLTELFPHLQGEQR